jgi:hypothetical protein
MRPEVVKRLTGVIAIAIAFAFGATFSRADPDERVEFLTHHVF